MDADARILRQIQNLRQQS
uniref:Uncharacterized protein n=1 Tax=Anguilla anguilla TaxID=7936 RepID=A0A0E9TNN5_ANGAN